MISFLVLWCYPEWRRLSRSQRRMVWASLFDPLVSAFWVRVTKTVFGLGGIAVWWAMRGAIAEALSSVGLIVLVFGLPEIIEAVVLLRGGRRLGSFVREHVAQTAYH